MIQEFNRTAGSNGESGLSVGHYKKSKSNNVRFSQKSNANPITAYKRNWQYRNYYLKNEIMEQDIKSVNASKISWNDQYCI